VKQLILVIEDNPLNAELLRDWLEAEGYEVSLATNLKGARAFLEARQPSAVLLDIQLGADDGLALLSWIRRRSKIRDVPVIAVTAQAMVAEQQNILKRGCNGVVSKPIDFGVLKEQLQSWLNRARV
jgi:CheY-like chemotaxis protein